MDGVASSEVHAASGKVRTFTLLNVITGLQLTINGCKLVLYADDFMVIQAYKELFLKRTLILYKPGLIAVQPTKVYIIHGHQEEVQLSSIYLQLSLLLRL